MPHIFRFHVGRNNNIYDWTNSDRIQSSEVSAIQDRTNILTSSAGTSIPTPLARMFLFKTGFEILAGQVQRNEIDKKSIYAGLVSETLDLLELLYKNGDDINKFEYKKWTYDLNQDGINVFGTEHGHLLLEESFKQAASQPPFSDRIDITLIYYKEGNKKILAGATSPFTFVFTSPNFRRKLQDRSFRAISGLVSNDILFDSDYKQLHERDSGFIKYIEQLATTPGIQTSFSGFSEYVINIRNRYGNLFNGSLPMLQNIQFDNSPLAVANINLRQLSEEEYKESINHHSDFKLSLPDRTSYTNSLTPLFLLDRMDYDGQYTSPNNQWSANTRISDLDYPAYKLEDFMERELPGMTGIRYPFLSSFDFFEPNIIKLPGYSLNNDRFVCIIGEQTFLYPIKPIFFYFFPINDVKDYISIDVKNDQVTVTLKIPVYGPTRNKRVFVCSKRYSLESAINYCGILGIFPLTRATDTNLKFINTYTVASYEKTNEPVLLNAIKFYRENGISDITILPYQRSNYEDINTKTTYYQINTSFDIIQLNFKIGSANCGGIIIPKFKEVKNGTEEYVYAIDFGTSNTHVEYGRVVNGKVTETLPFTIDERAMQMTLLNKPKEVTLNDGADCYNDYERSMGFIIDTARKVTLREFIPFQVGSHPSASIRFPFRTATCESNNFIANSLNNRLFLDANIGFNIDDDAILDNLRYKTDLKWLLGKSINDPFNKNRISLFFRQLLLMIRTKVLLEESNSIGDINSLKIALSFPISMSADLKNQILKLFNAERIEILGQNSALHKEVTESIAPFYQLKSINVNIQNDSYCNIDIGGGTTDIVLIDKNPKETKEIFCYCASFKFAGKQLWSSGSNEYNILDNGFLSYYKSFIERTNPDVYGSLKRLLSSSSNRSEDIVGLLFSQSSYRFADIFTDNKEFKAVLLIHYSSILYYITLLTKYYNIELPRTISFSGKGSEYLNIIFPNNSDLKGFTQKILNIYSDKPTRADFSIERSTEPKVITAKGSAHFAVERIDQNFDDWNNGGSFDGNNKTLKSIETNFKGFKSSDNEKVDLNYGLLSSDNSLFNDILNNHSYFFKMLFDNPELCTLINKRLEIKDFSIYKQFFIPNGIDIYKEGKLRDSFKSTLTNFDQNDKVTDAPFFFPLNYALIELSREIAINALK